MCQCNDLRNMCVFGGREPAFSSCAVAVFIGKISFEYRPDLVRHVRASLLRDFTQDRGEESDM